MLPQERLAEEHRQRFERFAQEVRDTSPLYEKLSRGLANEPIAEELIQQAPPSQRRPNLLFAAVHDLLLAGENHPLAHFYPTVTAFRDPDASLDKQTAVGADEGSDPVGAFVDLLSRHQDRIAETMRDRHTQTNEVGRCSALWPGLRRAAAPVVRGRPLTLIELGSSAGLLLHLDRYGYPAYGRTDATVRLDTEVIGEPLEMPSAPAITRRIGIDLDPLNVDDPDDVQWLMACIWPEHVQRLVRTRSAIQLAQRYSDVEVVRGDLVEQLPKVLRALSDDTVPCVLHSAALAYLDADERAAVADVIAAEGARRDLIWLSYEGAFLDPFRQLNRDAPTSHTPDAVASEEAFLLGASVWSDGRRTDRLLGRGHSHGRWVHHLDVSA